MSIPKLIQRRPTAQESVLAALRADLLSGVLAPGEQFVQEALAARYGVSRVPLREALKILEGEGLVTHHPHRGYFVAQMSMDDLLEVYRIREILEGEVLQRAATRLTDSAIEDLAQIAAEVASALQADDLLAITEANRRFHFAIFEAGGMPRIVRLLRQLWDASDVYRSVYFSDVANRASIVREHEAILDALRRSDGRALADAHDLHRGNAVAALSVELTWEKASPAAHSRV